jgi:ABC-2 type transport system ATP-binding protein
MQTFFFEVRDVSKNFGSFPALTNISFEIDRGEFFGLLGPNGAGKTTTINLLTGLMTPTQGTITLDGIHLSTYPQKYKACFGLVPQDFAFYSSLTAADNLLFFGRLYGLGGRKLQSRLHSVLENVQLSDRKKQTVSTFSNGMKRRLNIAIALLHQPQLLILDEPTVGVDAQSRHAIFEALHQLNREGTTILFTTHIMEEAEKYCRRVAILDQGKVVALDTPGALINGLSRTVVVIVVDGLIDEALQQKLTPWGTFHLVRENEMHIELIGGEKIQILGRVLEILRRENLGIKTFSLQDSNLETVFLHLTGKALRDGV